MNLLNLMGNPFLGIMKVDGGSAGGAAAAEAGAGTAGGGGAAGAGGAGGAAAGAGGAGAGAAGAGAAGAGAGSGTTDWKASLDADIKDHTSLADFKDDLIQVPKALVKSYVGNQHLIGVDKIPIPQNYDKPEVRDKFVNDISDRLGRPKEAKDYKFTEVKQPEGVNFKADPAVMEALKVEAHKLGILPYQLDGIYKWHMTDTGNRVKAYQEKLAKGKTDAEAALRSEMGAAYPAKVAKAQEMLTKFAGADYKQLLDSGFGDNPAVIRFMSKMADIMSEDAFEKGAMEVTMTPAEAQKALPEITKKLIEMKKTDPEYQATIKRKRELYEMAYPEKKAA